MLRFGYTSTDSLQFDEAIPAQRHLKGLQTMRKNTAKPSPFRFGTNSENQPRTDAQQQHAPGHGSAPPRTSGISPMSTPPKTAANDSRTAPLKTGDGRPRPRPATDAAHAQLATGEDGQRTEASPGGRSHGHIHIDRFTLNGPLEHDSLGEKFYRDDPDLGIIVAGASAYTPKRRKNPRPGDIFIKSSVFGHDERANRILFDCCPPQVLQGHNVFGHGKLLDYGYAVFLKQLELHRLTATPEEHVWWKTGRTITVSEVHLTGNFWIPPHLKMMFINAIDEANKSGKHRAIDSCIALGYTASRRSAQQGACIYNKAPLLLKEWSKPGVYQGKLIELANGSIRIEVRLYEGGLTTRELKSASCWANVDVDQLFFDVLSGFNVGNTIQPLLTGDEEKLLTKAELITYLLWLHKHDLRELLSASTISRHSRAIKLKAGVDILSDRRPERLPALDLSEILRVENIVPVPDWLIEAGRYWPPGRYE